MDISGINSKNNFSFILASKSPRRRHLLNKLNIPFRVDAASINEDYKDNEKPQQLVQRLAQQKAKAVAVRHSESYILGADTVVAMNDEIIGKPNSSRQATHILQKLSDKTHEVFTGVALLKTDEKNRIIQKEHFFERTSVTFGRLSPALIQAYLKMGKPMDKAGAYGIQDRWGAIFVQKIEGDFYNVVGLPLHSLFHCLIAFAPEFFNLNSLK